MAKISPVSIKYMIHANFIAEGALEKPDIIGALFGQTEGLLGSDLEMRDLQKEGKIGRIEVEVERKDKRTIGKIQIPTALDQSETTLIAAAVETIERIGPSDAQIEVVKIEDVRGSKRDYILDRAKRLMQDLNSGNDSREISNQIKTSARAGEIQEYGNEKLPAGDISGNEVIVVEGRADVLNLLRNNVKNVIGMNGTKLPDAIKELGEEKELTLFVDGDRGGKLIIQNVTDNAKIAYIAIAPDGKEVEELTGKEILIALRKKVQAKTGKPVEEIVKESVPELELEIGEEEKAKLKEIFNMNSGTEKALVLNAELEQIKDVSVKGLANSLKRMKEKPSVVVIDGTATTAIISAAEEAETQAIVAKNFASTDTKIKLLSF